jgi:hypothetical protein
MKYGFIDQPNFSVDIYNVVEKSGSRKEYSLTISDDLKQLGSQISDLPLRFASIVHAFPSTASDQEFHSDDTSGERAIVYLTDVESESSGPIEFKEFGKILGKSGTYVKYSANEIHRGCVSDVDRYVLALAFDDSSKEITTIGGPVTPCFDYECPAGFALRDPLPSGGAASVQNCCYSSYKANHTALIIFIVVSALFLSYQAYQFVYILRKKY